MLKQLSTQLSTHTIHLGTGNDRFEVTVQNLSDRFATFALELSASGLNREIKPDWYQLTPDLSAKIPAGDQVTFVVTILEVPPVTGGFTGKMNLNVTVTCLELGAVDRHLVNLVVAGSGSQPPVLTLPIADFQATPGELIEIPLQIYNPNPNTANLRAVVKGLSTQWLIDGYERRLQVAPNGNAHTAFICKAPLSSESKTYPFTLEVGQSKKPAARVSGSLTILPTGWVEFTCVAEEGELETSVKTRKEQKNKPTGYTVELINHSNVSQAIAFSLTRVDISWHEKLMAIVRRRLPKPALTTKHTLHLTPADVMVKAGDRAKASLTTYPNSPWLGWRQRQQFRLQPLQPQTSKPLLEPSIVQQIARRLERQPSIEIRPYAHTVELSALPKIPFWLQCLALMGLGLGTVALSTLHTGHHGPVNSVQFDGQANAIISASDDQSVHIWQVSQRPLSRQLRDMTTLRDTDKSVRVASYRPLNNNLLTAGLENGEIQIWDFLAGAPPITLLSQRDDRVFALQFSRDSKSLFSAHGSGNVLRWDLGDGVTSSATVAQQKKFDFAIQAIALVGAQNNVLAVGGRFNQLALWNFETNQQQFLNYPNSQSENPNDYLSSLDVAEDNPERLAIADNQGRISLWNVGECLRNGVSVGRLRQREASQREAFQGNRTHCQPTDQWKDGHQGEPVNAVALSKDACYLVSGGADGRIMLWSLNDQGQAIAESQLAHLRQPVNSVDLVQRGKTLLIASGGDDHRVRLHRAKANNRSCR
jgi:WD40 repeat protein